ncbi:hypothetical protein [Pseudorhodoferax sp. Leaf267]|uniref:hypothetical protein n=1 Tax=Pseudorhodoferax sp. Leaf267 TaxID=1736316 RepID=UPI001F479FC5|nr:hypothetical protein [Pseudorhodoferax sp. Leaf267]
MPVTHPPFRRLRQGLLLWLACLLAGCAGLPARPPTPPVAAVAASPATALGRAAEQLQAGREPTHSSVRSLSQANFALDARLTLMRRAQASLDVQTYQIGNDKTGRLILRELRDATRPGAACACGCCWTTSTPPAWTRCCWPWPRSRTPKCGCSTPS